MARLYYRLDDSQGKMMVEMAESFVDHYFDVEDNRTAFMREHGIASFLEDGLGGIKAVKFHEQPATGWKESIMEKGYFVPNIETAEGRDIRRKIAGADLIYPAPVEIWRKLDAMPVINAGRVSMPGVERFDGNIVVSIPETKFNMQPGMQEISRAEYMSMRDAAIQNEAQRTRAQGMRPG